MIKKKNKNLFLFLLKKKKNFILKSIIHNHQNITIKNNIVNIKKYVLNNKIKKLCYFSSKLKQIKKIFSKNIVNNCCILSPILHYQKK